MSLSRYRNALSIYYNTSDTLHIRYSDIPFRLSQISAYKAFKSRALPLYRLKSIQICIEIKNLQCSMDAYFFAGFLTSSKYPSSINKFIPDPAVPSTFSITFLPECDQSFSIRINILCCQIERHYCVKIRSWGLALQKVSMPQCPFIKTRNLPACPDADMPQARLHEPPCTVH